MLVGEFSDVSSHHYSFFGFRPLVLLLFFFAFLTLFINPLFWKSINPEPKISTRHPLGKVSFHLVGRSYSNGFRLRY